MRRIMFRAKTKDGYSDNGKFWYWNLLDMFSQDYFYSLDWETVGQNTGLKDSKEVEIFEGDILKRGETTDRVIFEYGAFCIRFYSKGFKNTYTKTMCEAIKNTRNRWEIIGNIYEHKHLLEEK